MITSELKKQTAFRLPVGILRRLETQARREYQSMTSVLTRILNKELPEIDQQPKQEGGEKE